MSKALELAAGRPWLMLPEALDTLLAMETGEVRSKAANI